MDHQTFLQHAPNSAGVYRMLDEKGGILYIGKAKHLKKRLQSYFRSNLAPKTARMMAQMCDIKLIPTQSETEALLLECELIKKHKPRYNILLRDDKSYPYLVVSKHQYPRLMYYRGLKKSGDRYFGPYPSGKAVRETLELLQRVFLLRDCSDSFFANRSRPCLQYQIHRCSAPCVNYISREDYEADVKSAMDFLRGKDDRIIETLQKRMNSAAQAQRYEEAARCRDQITSLRDIQATQAVANVNIKNADIVSLVSDDNEACVCVLMIRANRLLGDKHFFLKLPQDDTLDDVLLSFLSQYYLNADHTVPDALITSLNKSQLQPLLGAIQQEKQQSLKVFDKLNEQKRSWLEMAASNAEAAFKQHRFQKMKIEQQFQSLNDFLKMDVHRIECFDISHQQGEASYASNVVFDEQGPCKRDYRTYKMTGITGGDDYAAMRQALMRRFSKGNHLPEVLIIDGGKGQIAVADDVLQHLQLANNIVLLSISKGKLRRAEADVFYRCEEGVVRMILPPELARFLLQSVRDEAHRFAISAHQKTKTKKMHQSVLDQIPGVGAKRRRALLNHFGGLQALKTQHVNDIAKVPGVSFALAKKIYDFLH